MANSGFDPCLFALTVDVRILDSFECSICAGIQRDPLAGTRCGHSFCAGCITRWAHANETCPLCRADIPGADDCNVLRPNLDARQAIAALPFQCTEEGCEWRAALGESGIDWQRHMVSDHPGAWQAQQRPSPQPEAEEAPPVVAIDQAALERRARWQALRDAVDPNVAPWMWAHPDQDTQLLADLPALLEQQDHPPQLVPFASASGARLGYLHVWNQRTQKYMRSVPTQSSGLTPTGMFRQGRALAAGPWQLTTQLEPDDARVAGSEGSLVRWMASEIAKAPARFLSLNLCEQIDGLPLETRVRVVMAHYGPAQQSPREVMHFNVDTHPQLHVPTLSVFRADNLDEPYYWLPRGVNDITALRRLLAALPAPEDLVRRFTRCQYAWTLLGVVCLRDRWKLVTRCTQVVIPREVPRVAHLFRMVPDDRSDKDTGGDDGPSVKRLKTL